MYNKIILDHFHNPRNLQEMKNPDATGMGASQNCGDVMTLFIRIQHGKIFEATFTTMGCGAAIASGSILTEVISGKTIEEARAITASDLITRLGDLPKIKHHCPELAIEALRSALTAIK